MRNPVIVIGSGIVAKTLVLALAQMNIPHIWGVKEQATVASSGNDPRSYALSPSSMNLLSALEIPLKNSVPVTEIELATGEVFEKPALHVTKNVVPLFHMADHVALERVLDDALREMGEEPRVADIDSLDISGATLRIDSERIHYALLISAEGKASALLKAFGISRNVTDYRQSAIVGKIKAARPHAHTACQIFTPYGPLGLLPGERDEYSYVWSQLQPRADALIAVNEARFLRELQKTIGAVTGEIELATPRGMFSLRKHIASRMVDTRFVAIGDAAHVVHPLAGQGLNLGFRDIAVLVDMLVGAKRTGLDLGSPVLLEDFRRARHGDIARIETVTDMMYYASVRGGGFGQFAMDLAFKIGDKFKVLEGVLGDISIDMPESAPTLLRGIRP